MNFSVEVEFGGDSDLNVMAEDSVTLLSVLSITAIVTTISLFFCGIPICVEIWRRKSTNEISGFPFLMGFLGGSFWLRYGFLKTDLTMITVNVVGVSLMFAYLVFYTLYSDSKTYTISQILFVIIFICSMLILVQIYEMKSADVLGFVCMSFNIVNFGAPLAGVKIVLRKRCCDVLPLPLCTANLLVSSQWCLYGVLVSDIYILIPNGAGVALALLQMSLFLVFPRQAGKKALLAYCFNCVADLELNEKPSSIDLEKSEVQDTWLKRNTPYQSSLPQLRRIPKSRKPYLTFIRSANIHPVGSVSSRTDSSADTTVTVIPNWSLTPSASHPELTEEVIQGNQDFDRIGEFDDFDRQWAENEMKRTQSAPDIPESISQLDVSQLSYSPAEQ